MSNIQPVQLQDEDGTTYTVYIEATNPSNLPSATNSEPSRSGRDIYLKFGWKCGGKAGGPIFSDGTAESNFEVSVIFKFPDQASNG